MAAPRSIPCPHVGITGCTKPLATDRDGTTNVIGVFLGPGHAVGTGFLTRARRYLLRARLLPEAIKVERKKFMMVGWSEI